jgi:hypothetical protein
MADLIVCKCSLSIKKGDMPTHQGSKRCNDAFEKKSQKDAEARSVAYQNRMNKLYQRDPVKAMNIHFRADCDFEYGGLH